MLSCMMGKKLAFSLKICQNMMFESEFSNKFLNTCIDTDICTHFERVAKCRQTYDFSSKFLTKYDYFISIRVKFYSISVKI